MATSDSTSTLSHRVRNMIARATLRKANDGKKMQEVDIDLLHGEMKAGAEHWHPYGFTSVPKQGDASGKAEALVVFPGGNRSHGIVVAIGDRRYRLQGLAEGEMAIHDDQGQKVHLTRGGIEIVSNGTVSTSGSAVSMQATQGTAWIKPGDGQILYLGGPGPSDGGTYAPVQTTAGPSQCVYARIQPVTS